MAIIKIHRNFQIKLNLEEDEEEYHPISGFTIIDNGVGLLSIKILSTVYLSIILIFHLFQELYLS